MKRNLKSETTAAIKAAAAVYLILFFLCACLAGYLGWSLIPWLLPPLPVAVLVGILVWLCRRIKQLEQRVAYLMEQLETTSR